MLQGVSRRKISAADYVRMGQAGLLPEHGVELIEGEIFDMSPVGSKHFSCVNTLLELLIEQLGRKVIVSVQNPVQLNQFSLPEPDIAILLRSPDRYSSQLPGPSDVLLIIEVADSTLKFDKEVKLPLYAAAGIPEYWIINLESQEIESYWNPEEKSYKNQQITKAGERILSNVLGIGIWHKEIFE